MSESSLRPGVRLALDWGQARIGVAACDRAGILSFPVTTITNEPKQPDRTLDAVMAVVDEYEPFEVLLGLPVALSGREELAASSMRDVAARIAGRLGGTPLRLVDERMSSAAAHRSLASAGRDSRRRRGVIDQAAAVAILEQALETERRTGTPAGHLFDTTASSEQPPTRNA